MSKFVRKFLIPCTTKTTFMKYSSHESATKKPNIDYKDVKFHSKYSNEWWNVNGPHQGLHLLNVLRVPFIRDGLINVGHQPVNPSRSLEGIKIVDVACGGGILSEPLARIGASVIGIDASTELIEVARQHAMVDPDTSNIKYINTTVEDFAATSTEKFDAVVASEVIEHILDKKSFLKACTDLLKPGGSIFLTTLNRTVVSYVGAILLAENVFFILPKGTHNWEQFISPEETRRILNEYNCHTKLIHGMMFNVIRWQWQWYPSTSISYALHAVKSNISEDK